MEASVCANARSHLKEQARGESSGTGCPGSRLPGQPHSSDFRLHQGAAEDRDFELCRSRWIRKADLEAAIIIGQKGDELPIWRPAYTQVSGRVIRLAGHLPTLIELDHTTGREAGKRESTRTLTQRSRSGGSRRCICWRGSVRRRSASHRHHGHRIRPGQSEWHGLVIVYLGQYEQAFAYAEEGLAYAEKSSDCWQIAHNLVFLGHCVRPLDYTKSTQYYIKSIALFKKTGARRTLAYRNITWVMPSVCPGSWRRRKRTWKKAWRSPARSAPAS